MSRVRSTRGADPRHSSRFGISSIPVRLKDRLVTLCLSVAFVLLFAFAAYETVHLLNAWEANRAIRSMAADEEVEIGADAPPRLLLAAAYRRLAAGDLAQAEALGTGFETSREPEIEAAFWFALANARMETAFDQIEANDINEATVTIRLAQDDYRRAMRLTPDDFDIKYNFDIASRLVRVFPRTAIEPEEDGKRPRDVWTDLPGVPRGLP
ncbi:hypothetical protein [Fulvimarina endophytica]|uniref:hypothetical protein n=1 Tax=Fulvimarina endophytica TaxID=2293836 RepID=UPI001314500A|nr:hypothetical protein [Fulvimarina endophytica]